MMCKRFYSWLALMCVMLLTLAMLLWQGISLDTNILSLLPKASAHNNLAIAADVFAKMQGRQVIFLVGSQQQKSAQRAADLFVGKLKDARFFTELNDQVSAQDQQAWGKFYYQHRASLLSQQDKLALEQGNAQLLLQRARSNLYSPMGISSGNILKTDPWFTFQRFILGLPKPASNVRLLDGYTMVHAKQYWYVLIHAKLRSDAFSLHNQQQITAAIQSAQVAMLRSYPDTLVLKTGMLFYAKAGADHARHEISTIGLGSIIGIIVLMLLTFRSLSPLCFTLLSGLCGFISAFVVTQLVFGSVYLFTLVFGASLIGIAVDYAFFYYAEQLYGGPTWSAPASLKKILPGISIGLINIVIAYAVLAIAPFPGLRQLALFSIVGLTLAYATVVCAFPTWLRARKTPAPQLLPRLTAAYLGWWQRLSGNGIILIYTVLAIFVVLGLCQVRANDSLKILQPVNPALKKMQQHIEHMLGNQIGMRFVVVAGHNPAAVISHEHSLTLLLRKALPTLSNPYLAISEYVPSEALQQQNYQLIKQHLLGKTLLQYLREIGVPAAARHQIQSKLQSRKFIPLTVQAWLASPVSNDLRFLWLGKLHGQYFSVVLLNKSVPHHTLANIVKALPYVAYINKTKQISHVFARYRVKISYLLLLVYSVLALWLFLRYPIRKAVCIYLPTLFATACSVAALGVLQIPLTLFSVLALFIVIGVSVDYVVFFAETRSHYHATMLAVTLSAITTLLSFGLLSISSTPVIHYFGVTVLIGIGVAFLLAPMVSRLSTMENTL